MKTYDTQIIKKYTYAFLYVYRKCLTPDDFNNLSKVSSFLKKRKTSMFIATHADIDLETKGNLFLEIFMRAAPDSSECLKNALKKLVIVLVMQNRLPMVIKIIDLIGVRFAQAIGYQEATIMTSHRLSSGEQQEIIKAFGFLTASQVNATFRLDTELIAGIKIISQNYIWESSIAQKIRALRMVR